VCSELGGAVAIQVGSLRSSVDSRRYIPNRHDWRRKLMCFHALGEPLKDPVDGCPADAKGGRYSAGRLPVGVHPLRQCSFRCVKGVRPADRLTACPPRLTRCGPALTPQFQLKLSETGQDARHHPACRIRGSDALTQGAQDDSVELTILVGQPIPIQRVSNLYLSAGTRYLGRVSPGQTDEYIATTRWSVTPFPVAPGVDAVARGEAPGSRRVLVRTPHAEL
jgi:hypothetical protein